MADVTHVHPELQAVLTDYELIEDCCAGQRQVKSKGVIYLPIPDPDESNTKKKNNRYLSYLQRAIFTNFTGRTLEGFTGLIFNKPPVVEVPTLCKVVQKNADGSGISLEQQAKVATQHVIKKGRAGLLTDYPMTDKPASRAQVASGDIRPVILVYNPAHVINWDWGIRGAKLYYTLIVLKETYLVREPDEFEAKVKDQYRVLELVDSATGVREGLGEGKAIGPNAIYRQRIFRKEVSNTNTESGTFTPGPATFPKDGKGKQLSEIPFTFIGSVTNNAQVDKCPLIDIANENIAHYLNSADFEESLFMVGQPTLHISGITKQFMDEVYKGKEIRLGSRAAVMTPVNGRAELIQLDANTAAREAMKDKVENIVKLGAKIIEQGKVAKTATEDNNDTITENSVLGTIAGNVEAAFKWSLEWCAIFTGEITQDRDASDDSIKFVLNKKFDQSHMTAADRAQLLKEYLADVITFDEVRDNLDRAGIKLGPTKEAKAQIKQEQSEAIDYEVERNKELAKAGVGNQPNQNSTASKTATTQKAAA